MTHEKKKPGDDETGDEQLEEVAGGLTEPVIGSISDGVLTPKAQVDFSGTGETFSGTYYVDETEHSFDANTRLRQPSKVNRNQTGGS